MNDATTPPNDESPRAERLRSPTTQHVLAQLAKLLAAERKPRPSVVDWVTEPLEVALAPEPVEAPAEPVPTPAATTEPPKPLLTLPAEPWEVARPGNNVGRPRRRPAPPPPLIKLPSPPPAPHAPPLCTTLDWNAMWLRLSIWPMVAPLLQASVTPEDEVTVWRTLTEAGFPPSIIHCYLPEVLADLRLRRASAA